MSSARTFALTPKDIRKELIWYIPIEDLTKICSIDPYIASICNEPLPNAFWPQYLSQKGYNLRDYLNYIHQEDLLNNIVNTNSSLLSVGLWGGIGPTIKVENLNRLVDIINKINYIPFAIELYQTLADKAISIPLIPHMRVMERGITEIKESPEKYIIELIKTNTTNNNLLITSILIKAYKYSPSLIDTTNPTAPAEIREFQRAVSNFGKALGQYNKDDIVFILNDEAEEDQDRDPIHPKMDTIGFYQYIIDDPRFLGGLTIGASDSGDITLFEFAIEKCEELGYKINWHEIVFNSSVNGHPDILNIAIPHREYPSRSNMLNEINHILTDPHYKQELHPFSSDNREDYDEVIDLLKTNLWPDVSLNFKRI